MGTFMIYFGNIRAYWVEWVVWLGGRRGDECCRHGADEGRVTLTAVVVSAPATGLEDDLTALQSIVDCIVSDMCYTPYRNSIRYHHGY